MSCGLSSKMGQTLKCHDLWDGGFTDAYRQNKYQNEGHNGEHIT